MNNKNRMHIIRIYIILFISLTIVISLITNPVIHSKKIKSYISGKRYISITQSGTLWPTDFSLVKISAEIKGENEETLNQNSIIVIINNQDEQITADINYITATTEKVIITGVNMSTKEILVTFQKHGNGIEIKES